METKKERKKKVLKYMCVSIHPFHVTSLHEVQILGDISQAISLLKGNYGILIVLLSYVFGTERKKIIEICALLGCYTAYNSNSLPTFLDNLLVPSSSVKFLDP